jgi:hypothetical protein
VELVAIPIGHAGTTLQSTLEYLTTALSTARTHVEQVIARGITDPATVSNVKSHVLPV